MAGFYQNNRGYINPLLQISKSDEDEDILRRIMSDEYQSTDNNEGFGQTKYTNMQPINRFGVSQYDIYTDRDNFIPENQAQIAQDELNEIADGHIKEEFFRSAMGGGEPIKSAAEKNYEMSLTAPEREEARLTHKTQMEQEKREAWKRQSLRNGANIVYPAEMADEMKREEERNQQNEIKENSFMGTDEYGIVQAEKYKKYVAEQNEKEWKASKYSSMNNAEIALAYARGEISGEESKNIKDRAKDIYLKQSEIAENSVKYMGGGAVYAFVYGLLNDVTFGLGDLSSALISKILKDNSYEHIQLLCMNHQNANMYGKVLSTILSLPKKTADLAVDAVGTAGKKIIGAFAGDKVKKELASEGGEVILNKGLNEVAEVAGKEFVEEGTKKGMGAMFKEATEDAAKGYVKGTVKGMVKGVTDGEAFNEVVNEAHRVGMQNAAEDFIDPLTNKLTNLGMRSVLKKYGAKTSDQDWIGYAIDLMSGATAGGVSDASVEFVDSLLSGKDVKTSWEKAQRSAVLGGMKGAASKMSDELKKAYPYITEPKDDDEESSVDKKTKDKYNKKK